MQNRPARFQSIRFGSFEVDLRAGELLREGVRIRLQEQPFQILVMLLEHPGQVVTREELRDKLWPADTFVDFDHGLNKAINKLREALGDSAESPHFIETLAKRGYRFTASLESARPTVQTRGGPIDSIAVLPFLNLSTDPENELFSDGMCEEIITSLTQIKNLHVVARTSSFSFKGKSVDLRMVGQQLNVRTLLEGSVRRSGDRLRINAQLVNAADGYHLWSQQYDRELKDMFAIQEEIAHSIAQTLEVTLDSESQHLLRGGTQNLEAFKYYVRGRSLFYQRGIRLLPAVECFKKAVALDPKYGLAWSGLADAYNMVGFYGLAKPDACLPHAKDAAQRAIALDLSLAEAHMSLAMCHLLYDWDRSGAEHAFLRSFELKPRNSWARTSYGLYYFQWAAGRFEEGLEQTKLAVQIDPLSAYARAILAVTYLPMDAEKSLQTALETLQIDPDAFLGRWVQMSALNLLGRFAEAAEIGELAIRMFGRPLWMMASLAQTYARMGRRKDSEALYMELQWRARREFVAPLFLAVAAYATGERDEAMRLAQEAHTIGDPTCIGAKYWPDLSAMREDPRFQEILSSRQWT